MPPATDPASEQAAPPQARWRVGAAWAAGLSMLALLLLTYGIYRIGRVLRIDVRALDVVNHIRRHWLVEVFQGVTWAGDFLIGSVFLLVVAVVVSLHRRSTAPLWLGLTAVAVLLATVGTGKQVIDRSRIPFAVGSFGDGGTSYPSGHTTTAVVVGGTLVLMAAPVLTRRGLHLSWAAMVAYAGLIGVSRLYLRFHWLTDVIAGWLLGTVIVCLLALLFVRPVTPERQGLPEPAQPPDAATSAPDGG